MQIPRLYLTPDDISPSNQRYNATSDTVEITADGGATWTEQPGLDPRAINQSPPLEGASAACDAAARMSAAIEEIIGAFLGALQGGAGFAAIQGILVGWLAVFAMFPVLAALAALIAAIIVAIGYVTLYSEFNGFDWQGLTCLLVDYIDAEGRLDATSLADVRTAISAQYSSTQASVLNTLLDYTGFGALNAFAATRTETGDCTCGTCADYTNVFATGIGDNTYYLLPSSGFADATYEGARYAGGEWIYSEPETHGYIRGLTNTYGEESAAIFVDLTTTCLVTALQSVIYNYGGGYPAEMALWDEDKNVLYTTGWSTGHTPGVPWNVTGLSENARYATLCIIAPGGQLVYIAEFNVFNS